MGGIISGVFGLISTGKTKKKTKKEVKRQIAAERERVAALKEKERIEQVRADVAANKERKNQKREARIKRGQIVAQAANAGGLFSSSVAGGLGSINSQLASNFGDLSQAQGFGRAIGVQNQVAADARSDIFASQGRLQIFAAKQAQFEAIGTLAGAVADTAIKAASGGFGG